jgi:hypothetical protein
MLSSRFGFEPAPWLLGSLFGSFSPRGARSNGDQQPDGRVAHNQKLCIGTLREWPGGRLLTRAAQ